MQNAKRIIIGLQLFFVLMHSGKAQNSASSRASFIVPVSQAQLMNDAAVNNFYRIIYQQLFWFAGSEQSSLLRQTLKDILDSSANVGLDKADYHYDKIQENVNKSFLEEDSLAIVEADRIFTDAAINFCKDLYSGKNIGSWINADDISAKYAEKDINHIISNLTEVKTAKALSDFINMLEPNEKEYGLLKLSLKENLQKQDNMAIKQFNTSLNQFRWIHHFQLKKYIVVNIPAATLRYYENDTVKLKMKAVLGKPSTRTPRFAAYCNQVILYPYWNVPRKIAVNELLPLFKKTPSSVESMNMQIIDNHGKIVDPNTLEWSTFDKNNFPYQVRQSTGCDNALGVIKFNLTSPYDVYMHDTNFKLAFNSSYRYYSHGCIRLEKPLELANYLLNNRVDSSFIESCLKDQSPVMVQPDKPVPVFVVYIPAEADETERPVLYKDVYRLLK